KVGRRGGVWTARRPVSLREETHLLIYPPGLTDPHLPLAASAHLFAGEELTAPAALNGPQYISAGGTTDPTFRANGDIIRVPAAPGLGITLDERAEKSMTIAAEAA